MTELSIIIPARHEPYLQNTINSLLSAAVGEIEIIAVLDGWWPSPIIEDNPRVILIHRGATFGMRSAINSAARIAKGKYLMKCDAHCAFDKGFDKKLSADLKENWLSVPIRYSLDFREWEPQWNKMYEFEYIAYPDLKGRRWPEYAKRVEGQTIVDLMTFQGSCWFIHRGYFERIGGLDDVNYGSMGREAQEMCLKVWTSGGRCILNRNTWYAHWSKGKKDIKFSNRKEKQKSVEYAQIYWTETKIRPIIERFAPVPTWGENESE